MVRYIRPLLRRGTTISSPVWRCQQRRIHGKADRCSRPLSTFSVHDDGHTDPLTSHVKTAYLRKAGPSVAPPLSVLPLSSILRSISILTASCSPVLLGLSLQTLKILAHPPSRLFDAEQNPLLRWLITRTVYAQFCAGKNSVEVSETVRQLRDIGYKGVILAYARESEVDKHAPGLVLDHRKVVETAEDVEEIETWKQGNLQTVRLAQRGDFVALKFTGAGTLALRTMVSTQPCSPSLQIAITKICDLAASRDVRLLFDAEHAAIQPGIDSWTLSFMKRYNCGSTPVVFGTYQAYLKATPSVLSRHLDSAHRNKYTLGVKLVRGAYIGCDPRALICDTKGDTDAQYDGITSALLQKQYNAILKPLGKASNTFADVSLVLASHNQDSVRAARRIRDQQTRAGAPKIDLTYAQLMGMADEVSCELLAVKRSNLKEVDLPRAYKYLVWGTTGECMQYLLRRAQENKDAVSRTRVGRDAMVRELWRRLHDAFGMA
ncbi:MAG: proline dehydrogenase [Vezdaea aestivalis]|nr:MAG: proline dehydrogenase [Vezdaea aestivalis]